MMHDELVKLSGCDISYSFYTKTIEPMYMAVNMDKMAFINLMMPTLKMVAKKEANARAIARAQALGDIKIMRYANAYITDYDICEAVRVPDKGKIEVRIKTRVGATRNYLNYHAWKKGDAYDGWNTMLTYSDVKVVE